MTVLTIVGVFFFPIKKFFLVYPKKNFPKKKKIKGKKITKKKKRLAGGKRIQNPEVLKKKIKKNLFKQ